MNTSFFLRLLVLAAALAAPAVQAAVCRVAANGSGNGGSWSAPMTLQAALADAQCQEIWVRTGLYKPVQPVNPSNPTLAERQVSFQIRPGTRVYGGFAGTETRRDQRDPAQHRSVLSGDIDNDDTTDPHGIVIDPAGNRFRNSYHVVMLDGGTAAGPVTTSTVLDGLVITAGRANGSSSDRYHMGGGLFCRATNTGQHCSPSLRDVLFSGNTGQYGAAMALAGNQGGQASPTLLRVQFSANHATGYGGALYNDGSNAGIVSPLLRQVRFTGNRANSYGGAIYNDARAGTVNPVIEQTQFSGNSASYGGALYNDGTSAGTARGRLANITFQGNTAQSEGGAIYNEASSTGDTRLAIVHATFHGNTANRGGAIANTGSSINAGAHLQGVILWGNTGNQGSPDLYIPSSSHLVLANSLIAGGCPAQAQCANLTGGNPLLGPLADNGGWSWTMAPGNGSPAIDALSHAGCPTMDQRGVPRAQGTRCDIGAVEVAVAPCHVNLAATGANNGSSWANAYTSLQSALGSASCGEIRVARGVYKPTTGSDQMARFSIRPGQRVYGGFAGHETQLEQRDPAAHRTVLSGDIDNNDINDPDGILVHPSDRRGANSRVLVVFDGTTAAGPITATTVLDGFAVSGAYGEPLATSGGGIWCLGSGVGNECSPTLANLLISANYDDDAGGLYNSGRNGGKANPTLVNVTFRNNSANYGAGGMNNSAWGGTASPTLINVTFVGNGFKAMYNDGRDGGDASPTLNHVTFANNRDRFEGAAMVNFGRNGKASPVLVNVIAWGGTLNMPAEGECTQVEICNYFNAHPVIEASVIADGCPSGSLCGAGVSSHDPLLEPLADNGGTGPTLLPGAGGSAVDAGDDATCADTDQRGVSRPQGAGCDIGAVELETGGGDRIFANGFQQP